MNKIAICGGHISPALALIEELEKEKGIEIVFFGRKYSTEGIKSLSTEHKIIKEKGIKFKAITTGRLQRKFTRYTIPSLLKIPIGIIQSFYYLLSERPSVVVSFGGYVSVPVVFCAALVGIDVVSHEQPSVPGLATKINSIFSEKLFLTWPSSQKYFDREKTEVIGNLISKSSKAKNAKSKNIDAFIKKTQKLIVVTGGNQGSHFINNLITEALDLLEDFYILHLAGNANYKGDVDRAKKIKKSNYFAQSFINQTDMGAVLNRADLIIARSGANTVWEVATLGKNALFIPLPISASSEQRENARILENAGTSKVLNQTSITPKQLKEEIDSFFRNRAQYKKNAQKFARTLPRDANEKLAQYVLKIN